MAQKPKWVPRGSGSSIVQETAATAHSGPAPPARLALRTPCRLQITFVLRMYGHCLAYALLACGLVSGALGCDHQAPARADVDSANAAAGSSLPAASMTPDATEQADASADGTLPPAGSSAAANGDAPPQGARKAPPADPVGAQATDTKAAHGRIMACCAQLAAEAAKSKRKDKRWEIVASICRQIAEPVRSGQSSESAAKTLIRAQILGLKVPGAC